MTQTKDNAQDLAPEATTPEQADDVSIATGSATRLSWDQRVDTARMAMAAKDVSVPSLEKAPSTIHITGMAVFPAKSAAYPQIEEVAVIRSQEGIYRTFTAAGVESVKLVASLLGPAPWPEPFLVTVVMHDTKHGKRAALGFPA